MRTLSRYLCRFPVPESPGSVLLFSTKTTAKVVVTEALLAAAESRTLPPEQEATLARLGFLVDDAAAERDDMLHALERMNERRNAFHAIVMLNLSCNLDCPYCFEGGVRGNKWMSPETAGMLVDYVSQRHLTKDGKIFLEFYGGEPLLSVPRLFEIARQLQERARETGTELVTNLISNGTLFTRKVAEQLREVGLKKIRMTLDGPPELHDRSRPFAGGGGSFETIVRNILDTWDLAQIQLGGNFTQSNWREFPRLLDILLERGITPEKLAGVQFAPVIAQEHGGCRDSGEGCITGGEEWITEATLRLREETIRRGFRGPKIAPTVCLAEYDRDFVVSWDGTMYKCPGLVGREDFAVGKLPEGPQSWNSYAPDVWKKDECLNCRYLPLCFGGCRYLRVLDAGKVDGVDCRKEFYDAALGEMVQ